MGDRFENRVWFTRKARIRASERLLRNHFHSQFLLGEYALANTLFSISLLRYPDLLGPDIDSDLLLALLAVAILVLSLLISGLDFKGRGLMFKANYLSLQNLELRYAAAVEADRDVTFFHDQYQELLEDTENHRPIDDKYFRVIDAGSNLTRPPSRRERFQVIGYLCARTAGLIGLYAVPIMMIPLVLFYRASL